MKEYFSEKMCFIGLTPDRLHQKPSLENWFQCNEGDFKPVFPLLQCAIWSKNQELNGKNWNLLEKSTFFLEKICFQKSLCHTIILGLKMSHRVQSCFSNFNLHQNKRSFNQSTPYFFISNIFVVISVARKYNIEVI